MIIRFRDSYVATLAAFEFGPVPQRVMAFRVRFPDIGGPVLEQVGFLRYPGESIQGEAEPVAAGSSSDHSL